MPSRKNIETVVEIKKKLNDHRAIFIADFTGLNVKDTTELRKKLKNNDITMKVYKNRLVKIALKESSITNVEEFLRGVSTFIFAKDGISPAKLLVDFSRKNENLKLKVALIDGKIFDKEKIDFLSKIPSKEELFTFFLSSLNAPIVNFVYIFEALFTEILWSLETIIKQKEDK